MTSHLSLGVGAVNLDHHSATPKTLLKMIDHSWKKASELSFCLFRCNIRKKCSWNILFLETNHFFQVWRWYAKDGAHLGGIRIKMTPLRPSHTHTTCIADSPTVDSAVRKYFLMMVGFKTNDEEDENLFWRSECVSLRLCCKKNVHSFSVDKCECYSADLGFGYLTLHCSALEEGAAKHFHSTLHFAKHFHSWRSPGITWWSGVFRSRNLYNKCQVWKYIE